MEYDYTYHYDADVIRQLEVSAKRGTRQRITRSHKTEEHNWGTTSAITPYPSSEWGLTGGAYGQVEGIQLTSRSV